jgi:hypothetical protein
MWLLPFRTHVGWQGGPTHGSLIMMRTPCRHRCLLSSNTLVCRSEHGSCSRTMPQAQNAALKAQYDKLLARIAAIEAAINSGGLLPGRFTRSLARLPEKKRPCFLFIFSEPPCPVGRLPPPSHSDGARAWAWCSFGMGRGGLKSPAEGGGRARAPQMIGSKQHPTSRQPAQPLRERRSRNWQTAPLRERRAQQRQQMTRIRQQCCQRQQPERRLQHLALQHLLQMISPRIRLDPIRSPSPPWLRRTPLHRTSRPRDPRRAPA